MKSVVIKKAALCVIALFLALCFVFGLFAETIEAADTGSVTRDTDINGRDKASRADYRGLIKKIKKENRVATIKNNIKEERKEAEKITEASKTIANTIIDWIEDGADADRIENVYNISKTAITLAANMLGGPLAGNIAGAAVEIIDSLLSMGEKSESELEQLENRMNEQFEEVHKHLDEIQQELSELSNQVEESTNTILAALENALDGAFAKGQVVEFLSSRTGNFDYGVFKDILYASADPESLEYSANAYYNKLMALGNNATEEELKDAYDRLFASLAVSDSQRLAAPIDVYYDYILESTPGIYSIQRYYYDYLSANRDLLSDEQNPEEVALDFTVDVYNTAIQADKCILYCNSYQLLYLAKQYGTELNNDSRYYYGDGKNDYVTYGDILNMNVQISDRWERLFEQLLADVTYIVNIEGSFMIEENGEYRFVNNYDENTFGAVEEGQTIHLNQYTQGLCDMFALNPEDFTYEWSFTDGRSNETGERYTVKANDKSFTGTVSYDGIEVYSIEFFAAESTSFSGGSGTPDDPYVISMAEQFKLIGKDTKSLKAYYVITKDITFTGGVVAPLGSELTAFNGHINGNGHTIYGLKVQTGDKSCGLFGYIGEDGYIENLTISGGSFTLTNNTKDTVYIGAFAGVCDGTLYNCFVKDKTNVSVTRSCTTEHNQAMTTYAGGFVGECSGTIERCGFENSTVYVNSYRHYQTNSDGKNANYVYSGTIAANLISGGYVGYCYNTENAVLDIHAKSVCKDNMSSRHPKIELNVSGMIGSKDSSSTVEKLYSVIGNITRKIDKDNTGFMGGADSNNCKARGNQYVTGFTNEDIDKIKAVGLNDVKLSKTADKTVTYSYKCKEHDNCGEVCSQYKYEYGALFFNVENLEIYLDGVKTDYNVVAVYGFDSTQTRVDAGGKYVQVEDSVLLLIEALGEIYKIEVPVIINENKPVSLKVEVEPNKVYSKIGEAIDVSTAYIVVTYQDGTTRVVTNKIACGPNTIQKIGEQAITLTYTDENGYEVECELTVDLVHTHSYNTFVVLPTCNSKGYTQEDCTICGKTEQYNFTAKLAHTTVVYDSTSLEAMAIEGYLGRYESTCHENGYSGDLYCTSCQTIVGAGEKLGYAEHDYELTEGLSHICRMCNNSEEHMFTSVENELTAFLSCVGCGYTTEMEINSKEALDSLPRVIVSDAYALAGSNEVVVFVELHSSTGITGAYFTVSYGNQLELVDYDFGNILNKPSVEAFKEYSNHLNVILAQDKGDFSTSGTLLKLVFKTPQTCKVGDTFEIEVTNKNGADKFLDADAKSIDFISLGGRITVVERLPGDVDGDGIVDLVDASILAKYLVLDNEDKQSFVDMMKGKNPNFDLKYGDVTLSGGVEPRDILQIIRFIVGGYDALVLAEKFDITLNYNDGVTQNGTIKVDYDSGNGTYGNGIYAETESGLPEIKRDGYKFLGWYTSLGADGTLVTNSNAISYDEDQIKPMLYAKYQLNKVTFDGNGATGDGKQSVTYVPGVDMTDISLKESEFSKVSILTFNGGGIAMNTSKAINHSFKGWALTPDGKEVFKPGEKIDLKTGGYNAYGNITLYAVWSKEAISPMDVGMTANGYAIEKWTTDDGYTELWDNASNYNVDGNKTLYAKWEIVNYVIEYHGANGATSGGAISYRDPDGTVRNILTSTNFTSNSFNRKGYTFAGWNTKADGSGIGFGPNDAITYIETDANNVAHLYAQWKNNGYTVYYNPNGGEGTMAPSDHVYDISKELTANEFSKYGYHFDSWNTKADGSGIRYENKADCNFIEDKETSVTLYAQWKGNPYTIKYNGNIPSNASSYVYNLPSSTTWYYDDNCKLGSKPTLTGWTFGGWYRDAACTVKAGDANTTLTSPNYSTGSAVTLYAKWTANTYSVVYNANGGSGSTATSYFTYDTGSYLRASGYYRSGYTFMGWSTSWNAQVPEYSNGAYVKNLSTGTTKTLYAVWVKTSSSASFTADNGTRDVYLARGSYHSDKIYTGMDKAALKANNYKTVEITVVFDAQRHFLIQYNQARIQLIASGYSLGVQSWETSGFANNAWTQDITVTFTIDVAYLNSDGSFVLQWCTLDDGGSANDGWYFGETSVSVTAKK